MQKKILFVLPFLNGGGAERVTLSLLNNIDRTRWESHLILLLGNVGALDLEVPKDVKVQRLGKSTALKSLFFLIREVWKIKPDLLFVSLDHLNALIGSTRFLLPSQTKVVLRVTDFGSLRILKLRTLLSIALRCCDLIVYQSQEMADTFRQRLKLSSNHNTCVIRNPLSVAKIQEQAHLGIPFERPHGRIVLVAAGRLSSAKGFDLLIEAIHKVHDERIYLQILGEGPLLGDLVRQCERLNLQSQVQFLGFQENPWRWIAQADLFVLSSRSEGFPNVVLEALACHVPVLSYALPGLSNLPGTTIAETYETDAQNIVSLASSLRHWLDKRPEFPLNEVNSYIDSHSSQKICLTYEIEFEKIISQTNETAFK